MEQNTSKLVNKTLEKNKKDDDEFSTGRDV